MIKRLKQSEFIGSVATLASGTVIGHLVAILFSPIITRLYTAEEMSYQSVFTRIVLFLSVIATARFEFAFALPKRMEHAYSLFRVSIKSLLFVLAITVLVVLLLQFYPFEDKQINQLLLLVPLGVLVASFYSQLSNWALRLKDFKHIGRSKIMMSIAFGLVAIFLYPLGYFGIITAYICSFLAASLLLVRNFKTVKSSMKAYQLKGRDYAIAKNYLDFPRINLPHALIDLSKELFIAFYMIMTFEKGVLGLYDLSFRMLRVPIAVIGSSIGQVFLKKAVDLRNEGKAIFPLLKKTMLLLFLVSIVPFSIIMFFGTDIFSLVFGKEWSEAGYYTQIMTPWVMVNFLISPVSQVPIILNKQRGFFMLGIASTVLMVLTLTIGDIFPDWHLRFDQVLKVVSFTQFLFLTFVIIWLLRLAKKQDKCVVY
ncbi:MAG: oligosaccharide flippase family protein [Fluviicola sp.]|nr:oligosaccharide flippase family protein [Fluviicola sp.]MBP6272047.1 oligosaccharide flippase family protein [Fluviicola sp.]